MEEKSALVLSRSDLMKARRRTRANFMSLLTNEIYLSCVCAERTSFFSAVAQRLKIGGHMNQNKETTTEITFKNTACTSNRTVRTQEIEEQNPSWNMVKECLQTMFEYEDEFVVLTVADAPDGIRFIQAAQIKDGITVQLGIEGITSTRLVEKTYTEEECLEIFQEFYQSSHVQNIEEYHPVEFMK